MPSTPERVRFGMNHQEGDKAALQECVSPGRSQARGEAHREFGVSFQPLQRGWRQRGEGQQLKEGSFILTAPRKLADYPHCQFGFSHLLESFWKVYSKRWEKSLHYLPSCFSSFEQYCLYPFCTVGPSQVMNLS